MPTQRVIDFRYAPAVRWSCIGRPDDPFKTLVDQHGALLYDFERNVGRYTAFRFKRTISFALQTDRRPLAIFQETESARLPIVRTTIHYPRATLLLRAAGHQAGRARTDIVLWEIRMDSPSEPFLTGLALQVQELNRRFLPGSVSAAGRLIYAIEDGQVARVSDFTGGVDGPEAVAAGEPPPLAFVSDPQPLHLASAFDFGPASGLAADPALVGERQPLAGALFFPLNHEQVEGLDFAWAQAALEEERRFWSGTDLQPLPLALPDPAVEEMVTACARNILQAREIKDGLAEFQVGPTIYRGLWVVDGHFFLEAAQYLGHAADALRGIDALLRRVDPETGAIEELKFHAKETGIALATIMRQSELQGDFERLRELWPVVRQAVGYIEKLREASRERGADAPEYGLMPRSFGDGGLGGLRAEYTTTLWTLIGLKEAARVAPLLGETADGARFQAAFEDLRRAFRERAARDMQTLPDGTPYLPMLMPGSGEHHWQPDYQGTPEPWERVNPGTGTWALAHAIYPGEVFPPDDPLVRNFCHYLDLVDDEEGIPAETGWLPYQGVWSYAASFYAHVWLYAGRPDKAIDYLYDFANHAAPTRVWREEQSFAGSQLGQLIGDMPHNWASVEFIRLVRHLLVWERGDSLELLPALPPEWLVPGRPLRIENTPTRFGPVSLVFEIDGGGEGVLSVGCTPDFGQTPQAVVLHVPAGLTCVQVDGQPAGPAANGQIKLPFTAELLVRFSKAA